LAEKGKIAIELIKALRNHKSMLQIPLNQEVSRVIILSENNIQNILKDLEKDIKSTIRIKSLEIFEKAQEDKIRDKPESKESIEGLGITFYFSRN
jgi:valyl-tRNA synthetase